ncbi:YlmH family RNA-binding protein [Geobacillus jurassicus]|uniref:RNA-binding protein n=1 Tax=Geobacillus jurassicus TaxID=235932 RepID=A0ABV6GP69_9BACL|nr:RNA-binding protein [Geobacillus jurassicus]
MELYQHFRKEEHSFVDQVLEWKEMVSRRYAPKLTDFLDPREQQIVQSIVGGAEEVRVFFFGGTPFVERKRAFLAPPYIEPEEGDYGIVLFAVRYPAKFVSLEHRDVLGSLMSLGLRRGKFGDILVQDGKIQFFTAAEVADYVRLHVKTIGKAPVALELLPLTAAMPFAETWQEETVVVSSLRLDAVLAQAFRLAREKARALVESGLVKVNWKVVDKPDFVCGPGDVLSARGFGRCKLFSVEGPTKKERWLVRIGRQK